MPKLFIRQLSPQTQAEFKRIVEQAKVRHEKARKAAKARGRHDFPLLPYEGSWAHEREFLRQYN